MRSKYAYLLADPDVKRWYNNVARGSNVTADVYLRRLGNFCEIYKLTPNALASMDDVKLYNLLMDFVSSREKEFAGSYIKSTIKAVKSWLSHNHRELKGKIKIRGVEDTPSLKDERVPTKDELRRIFFSGDKKARVACVLIAHSGLRIETLGNYSGDDGLRIKDFPEIEVKDGVIEFKKIPTIAIVRKELSKARHQYFTFLSEEGCEYLKDYLEERIRSGEKLTLDSPIITPKLKMKPFIRAINIGDIIRSAIRKAGFSWRPYVLRSYFDTQLMLAESKGLVLRDYRQFWMGHKGDIENRYTTNKQKLPESVIEDMREAYRRSQEYLQTTRAEASSEEKVKESFRKQLLLVAGFKKEEIEKMDLLSLSDEEFQSMVRQKLLGAMINNGAKQKVVGINEVEAYLSQGWEFVASLPNNKAIMKIPF
ncbi:MAG: site-specific integrase [Candidatus Bathyarchaeia archaeon]